MKTKPPKNKYTDFNVKEAITFLLIFKKLGNWREVLGKSEEVIDATRVNP